MGVADHRAPSNALGNNGSVLTCAFCSVLSLLVCLPQLILTVFLRYVFFHPLSCERAWARPGPRPPPLAPLAGRRPRRGLTPAPEPVQLGPDVRAGCELAQYGQEVPDEEGVAGARGPRPEGGHGHAVLRLEPEGLRAVVHQDGAGEVAPEDAEVPRAGGGGWRGGPEVAGREGHPRGRLEAVEDGGGVAGDARREDVEPGAEGLQGGQEIAHARPLVDAHFPLSDAHDP